MQQISCKHLSFGGLPSIKWLNLPTKSSEFFAVCAEEPIVWPEGTSDLFGPYLAAAQLIEIYHLLKVSSSMVAGNTFYRSMYCRLQPGMFQKWDHTGLHFYPDSYPSSIFSHMLPIL